MHPPAIYEGGVGCVSDGIEDRELVYEIQQAARILRFRYGRGIQPACVDVRNGLWR